MLLALQASSQDRQHEAKVLAGTDKMPHFRNSFTVEGFSRKYGPCVQSLLAKESTLNLHGIVAITTSLGGTSSEEEDDDDSEDENEDQAPPAKPMSMMQQLMAEERGEPVVTSQPPPRAAKKVNKKKNKEEEEDSDKKKEEEDMEIFAPYFDDETRQVKVCKWYPADGLHKRPLEELLNMVHFAALARDDPRIAPTQTEGDDQDQNGSGDDDVDMGDVSTKLQRLIAGYTTQSLCQVWERQRKEEGGKKKEEKGNEREGVSYFHPWKEGAAQQKLSSIVADNISGPWNPPPSEKLVARVTRQLEAVVHTPLSVPTHALLTKLWVPEMELGREGVDGGKSSAVSFFPVQDIEGLLLLATHGEVLRWRLIRAAVDDKLRANVEKTLRQLDSRMTRLLKPKTDTAGAATAAAVPKIVNWCAPEAESEGGAQKAGAGEKAEEEVFPSSLVGYYSSQKHFTSDLASLRQYGNPSAASQEGEVMLLSQALLALLFWDMVLFDLERTSRRGGGARM